ncbi:hypothetical protein MTR67_047926 [Solanum verrucosum]|uniref:Uncharacterized protein n=1 Tax=Solanum verrucosum TaxID=315347 RepID=A0AAF0ZWW8_SOLVR|nr:hypothetical protein MTR67_047926 [Solanum verrucosum]
MICSYSAKVNSHLSSRIMRVSKFFQQPLVWKLMWIKVLFILEG